MNPSNATSSTEIAARQHATTMTTVVAKMLEIAICQGRDRGTCESLLNQLAYWEAKLRG